MAGNEKFEGKTLSDALDRASERLGTPRDALEHRVIKESGGFFGLLGGKVVIEAWTKDAATHGEIETKYGVSFNTAATPQQQPARQQPARQPARQPAPQPAPQQAQTAQKPAVKQEPRPAQGAAGNPQQSAGQPGAPEGERGQHRSRRRRHGRGDRDTRQETAQEPSRQQLPSKPAEAQPPRPAPVQQQQQQEAFEEPRKVTGEPVTVGPEIEVFLTGLFAHIGEAPGLVIEENQEQATVRITVAQESIFSSREGHTIESLKTLLDKAINKGPVIRKKIRVHVSEAGSTESRELIDLGLELGRKARAIMKPISVRGLTSQDRKVIHTAVLNAGGNDTVSSGDGAFRKIYIVPHGARPEKPRETVFPADTDEEN
ncbi:MAG: Jag N-terminal domain-containing protein [Myxococcota bacterium]